MIDAEKSGNIWISLEDVTLHCDDDAAVRVEQADKVFLTLADGTKSTISSRAQYSEESTASGRDADGLDSNGDIYIEGGRTFISVKDGGSAMAEGFDADSPQGFLMHSAKEAAGTTISLADSQSREIISEEIPCILLGISILVLLSGLFMAIKMKY